ncbi:MAG: LysR family transcriptional regulator, partial [Myxococcota bacterium]
MTPKSLEAVTALATIARVGSFTRAAGELGVSRSALSHRIKTLEEILGVRVLNRTTRSLALTGAGEHLIAAVHPSLESISAALEEVAAWDGEPKGKLRLSVPRIAGLTVIRPRLSEFVRRYPGVELELSVNDGLVDIVAGGFDAGIRFLESVALDMVTVAVGPPVEFAAVAAPEYLTGRALPIHP